ncbi:MAG: type II toxin-antitoxin system RelE/ParE family toxin [Treponema sp.]|nr:type II toxin-antitoxin system RelE/ParE family toxin [Treponema sp.]
MKSKINQNKSQVYKPNYLPLALDDLKEIIKYIAHKLEAPRAAENLIFKIDKEIKKISENPFRCRIYTSTENLKYEYRVLHVNNYSIFYVIDKQKIEIHRVIYSKRDIPQILVDNDTKTD